MDDQVHFLRKTLQDCQKFMYNKKLKKQIEFALDVTSGTLPEGYQVDEGNGGRWYASFLVNGLRYPLQKDGKEKYFYSELKARLFAWESSSTQEKEGEDTNATV